MVSEYVHDTDDPLDGLELQAFHRTEEYGTEGWQLVLHVPNDAARAVLDKWGPK